MIRRRAPDRADHVVHHERDPQPAGGVLVEHHAFEPGERQVDGESRQPVIRLRGAVVAVLDQARQGGVEDEDVQVGAVPQHVAA